MVTVPPLFPEPSQDPCDGCGKPIGFVPASASIFKIRRVDEPEKKLNLCLSCITEGIEAATAAREKERGE